MRVRDVVVWLRHPVNGQPKLNLVVQEPEKGTYDNVLAGLIFHTAKGEIVFVPYDNIVCAESGREREHREP